MKVACDCLLFRNLSIGITVKIRISKKLEKDSCE